MQYVIARGRLRAIGEIPDQHGELGDIRSTNRLQRDGPRLDTGPIRQQPLEINRWGARGRGELRRVDDSYNFV